VTGAVRVAMGLLAVSAASIGIPATFAPRSFYDQFPFFASWVDKLPPYNAHLVTDTGGFYLAFTVLFTWAALRPSRELIVPVCVAWALTAALHLRFHIAHLSGFSAANGIAEIGGLAAMVALPLLVLAALRGARTPA
jgi:hypothetical protein